MSRDEILDLDRRLALPGQTRLVGTPGTTYVGQVLEDIVAPAGFSFIAKIEPTPVALACLDRVRRRRWWHRLRGRA